MSERSYEVAAKIHVLSFVTLLNFSPLSSFTFMFIPRFLIKPQPGCTVALQA